MLGESTINQEMGAVYPSRPMLVNLKIAQRAHAEGQGSQCLSTMLVVKAYYSLLVPAHHGNEL